jgi:hypothetical protein
VVPTLVNNEQLSRLLDLALRQEPLLQHVPLAWFGWWAASYGVGRWTEANSTRHRDFLARKKVLLEEVAKANGRVVAGSTTPHPYVLPDAGLQRELELLVEAGLTPMQAISAATRVAAEFPRPGHPSRDTGGGKTGRPGDPRGEPPDRHPLGAASRDRPAGRTNRLEEVGVALLVGTFRGNSRSSTARRDYA